MLYLQLHDASEYLIDRAEYSWSYSSTEDYDLYQPAASEPLQYNQTVWQYSAQPAYQDHR